MAKEIFPDVFTSFFHEMSQIRTLNEGAQKAFLLLQDSLHIGRVTVSFTPRKNAYLVMTKNLPPRLELFTSDRSVNQDLSQNYQFTLQDSIIVEISIYADTYCEQWSLKQISALALIAETTFIFISRLRFAELAQLNAMTDTLTGIDNSMSINSIGRNHCMIGDIGQYTAIQLNIRNFRLINQRFGTVLGDQILRKFGMHLSSLLHTGDTAARLGGDVFMLLVQNKFVDDILADLKHVTITVINENACEIPVEISTYLGVYDIPDREKDFGHIMEAVSNTLMTAKSSHTSILHYNDKLVNSMLKKGEIQDLIPNAIRNHEFIAYYQPKVSLEDYSLIGCEALVRWIHNGEVIMPGDFIPVLEEDDTICLIDFYMLEQVCRDINEWISKGFEAPMVSVNFSKHHLNNPTFVEDIMEVLTRYDIDPSYIEIEFTETSEFSDFTKLKDTIARMRSCGLTTSIDDFGTGYSSLNLIKDLSVDIIKLDKSFLSPKNDDRDTIVIRNVIQMAHELGIDIITEGVETTKQAQLLRGINCMMAQGFLFDKPLPKEEFEERMMLGQYPYPDEE